MVKFEASVNSQGKVYLPSEIRRQLGAQVEILGNAKAIVIFPKGTSAEHVLRSLDVVRLDLKHRVQLEAESK